MSGEVRLEGPESAAIETQLHALLRQQAKRAVPVELPRPDFWAMCSRLLQSIELDLAEIGRTEGWSVRAQTLSRRQANLRRTISDLTRHRLTAFVNHAALSNLASTPFGDAAPDVKAMLVAIDWQRHDGAERAFHAGVAELIEQYKQNVSWGILQQGVLNTGEILPTTPAGNAQLDSYVDDPGGLTGDTPPKMATPPEEEGFWEDPDFDDEDRIALVEAYPEFTETPQTETSPEPSETEPVVESSAMMRIRILKDMPEPLIDESGEDIELFEGDVHNCGALFAETLIASGYAEAAPLE
ncbi:MAG TPA: hypothetical protein EYQ80_05110 [Candidatus Poseidoniales archaeon]|nr:hypothetical protein [Candidatus Poseidoniales archaeon]